MITAVECDIGDIQSIRILEFNRVAKLIEYISEYGKNAFIFYNKCGKFRKIENSYNNLVITNANDDELDVLDTFIEEYFDKCRISDVVIIYKSTVRTMYEM